jgi:hypothetical protein
MQASERGNDPFRDWTATSKVKFGAINMNASLVNLHEDEVPQFEDVGIILVHKSGGISGRKINRCDRDDWTTFRSKLSKKKQQHVRVLRPLISPHLPPPMRS